MARRRRRRRRTRKVAEYPFAELPARLDKFAAVMDQPLADEMFYRLTKIKGKIIGRLQRARGTLTRALYEQALERGKGRSRGGWGNHISVRSPRVVKGGIVTGIKLAGIPAVQEVGGKLKPYVIRARKGAIGNLGKPALWLERGGALPNVRSVRHPGARLRGQGLAARELRRQLPRLARGLELWLRDRGTEFI